MDPVDHPPRPDSGQPPTSGPPSDAGPVRRPLTVPSREDGFGVGAPRRQIMSHSAPQLPPPPPVTPASPQASTQPPPAAGLPLPPSQPPVQPPQTNIPPARPTPPPPPIKPDPALMQRAAANDRKRSAIKTLKSFLSLVTFVATVVIAAMLINQFVFQSYYVDGSSMAPTLENEDRLIIDKVPKTFAHIQGKSYIPNRGDIVVLDSSILDRYGHNEQLIKRVVGLPGETVIIHDGIVTIKNDTNPEGFDLDKKLGLQVEPTYSETPIEVKVPENNIYVMGDNRGLNGSFDSRAFGPTSVSNVQGRLSARIFPFDRVKAF